MSSIQLLEWVRNPVPISQLDSFDPLKCSTPSVDSSLKICNGIPQNENGLLAHCAFPDFPFYTCVRSSSYSSALACPKTRFRTVWLPAGAPKPRPARAAASDRERWTDALPS